MGYESESETFLLHHAKHENSGYVTRHNQRPLREDRVVELEPFQNTGGVPCIPNYIQEMYTDFLVAI